MIDMECGMCEAIQQLFVALFLTLSVGFPNPC